MNVVLRFEHSGGTTDFYDTEVPQLNMSFIKGIDLFRVRDGFRAYNQDQGYFSFLINFQIKNIGTGTYTKLETLYNLTDASTYLPEAIKLYYEYYIDATSNYYVQMKRDDFNRDIIMGEIPANKIIPINFTQTVPEGVAVRGPIIGVT